MEKIAYPHTKSANPKNTFAIKTCREMCSFCSITVTGIGTIV